MFTEKKTDKRTRWWCRKQ